MSAKDHYDCLLGNVYSWMVGNFEEKVGEQLNFFRQVNLVPVTDKVAVDLGAGHGLQTIALAQSGYSVTAVDFNRQLLKELARRKGSLDIQLVEANITDFFKTDTTSADLVVCMGDTLTHMETLADVHRLMSSIATHLVPGGSVVFSFRDLTVALGHEHRFVPVKSDDTRILTCFLEYFPDHVMVYDILHEKDNGQWTQKISCYPKLRLNESMVVKMLQTNNFRLVSSTIINRMIYLVATKMV